MLPCVCSLIDHRGRQNVVKASATSLFSPHLTSSVIFYWTDARQHGIYLLNLRITILLNQYFFFDNSTLTTEMSESEVTFLDPIVYKGGSNESILDMQTLPPDINICYLLAGRSVLGETVTERSWVPVLRPRAQFQLIRTDLGRWITFLFFSYWDLKVSRKFSFTLEPMCVEVGRVRVDEVSDRFR